MPAKLQLLLQLHLCTLRAVILIQLSVLPLPLVVANLVSLHQCEMRDGSVLLSVHMGLIEHRVAVIGTDRHPVPLQEGIATR